MVSRSFFDAHPREFFDFYFDRMVFRDARPNACHRKLAELEAGGIVSAVITQNIDGLHQAAGSKRVLELHGSVHRNHCTHCHAASHWTRSPRCTTRPPTACRAARIATASVKPDVVLYEERSTTPSSRPPSGLSRRRTSLWSRARRLPSTPRQGWSTTSKAATWAIVNLSPTPLDRQANLCLAAPVGEVFSW